MKNEIIKEILDSLKDILDEPKGLDEMPNGNLYEYDRSYDLEQDEIKVLLDYITNLQEEKEDYKTRNEKAVELINKYSNYPTYYLTGNIVKELLNLLQGKE